MEVLAWPSWSASAREDRPAWSTPFTTCTSPGWGPGPVHPPDATPPATAVAKAVRRASTPSHCRGDAIRPWAQQGCPSVNHGPCRRRLPRNGESWLPGSRRSVRSPARPVTRGRGGRTGPRRTAPPRTVRSPRAGGVRRRHSAWRSRWPRTSGTASGAEPPQNNDGPGGGPRTADRGAPAAEEHEDAPEDAARVHVRGPRSRSLAAGSSASTGSGAGFAAGEVRHPPAGDTAVSRMLPASHRMTVASYADGGGHHDGRQRSGCR